MIEFFQLDLEIIIKLVLAIVLGGLVGLEREWAQRPAGLRTHMLVALGSALFTIASLSFEIDPARIAAGIVTGIGFIGAGAIIGSRGHVHGITTAASLWVVAGVGLAVGLGMYLLASITAVLVFIILQFKKVEKSLVKK